MMQLLADIIQSAESIETEANRLFDLVVDAEIGELDTLYGDLAKAAVAIKRRADDMRRQQQFEAADPNIPFSWPLEDG